MSAQLTGGVAPLGSDCVTQTVRTAAGRRGKDKRRIVDVYRSQSAAPISRDRVIIGHGSNGSHEVSRQRPDTMPDPPVSRDRDQIASLLAAMLTGIAT